MTEQGLRARWRRRPQPAGPRTLASWRRIGLALGAPALLAWGAALVLFVVWLGTRERGVGIAAALALGVGLLLAWLGRVFLQRVWSEPLGADSPFAARGRRALSVFDSFFAAGVLVPLLRYVGVPRVLAGTAAVVLYAAAAVCFGVAVLAALRDRRTP